MLPSDVEGAGDADEPASSSRLSIASDFPRGWGEDADADCFAGSVPTGVLLLDAPEVELAVKGLGAAGFAAVKYLPPPDFEEKKEYGRREPARWGRSPRTQRDMDVVCDKEERWSAD